MSNHLISEVYKRQVGGLACTAVLVLLADKASDDGSGIFASKQTIAEELGTTKPTVIASIKALLSTGLLEERGRQSCANGYTVDYSINVGKLMALPLTPMWKKREARRLTGKGALPVKERYPTGKGALPHRESSFTPPVKELYPNPNTTPLEPSVNHPSDTSYPQDAAPDDGDAEIGELFDRAAPEVKKARKSAAVVERPDDVEPQTWSDFLDHRRRKRANVTLTALDGIRSQARAAGWTMEAALVEMVQRGWVGFNADWVQEKRGFGDRLSPSEIGVELARELAAENFGSASPRTRGASARHGWQDKPSVMEIGMAVARKRRAAHTQREAFDNRDGFERELDRRIFGDVSDDENVLEGLGSFIGSRAQ